MCEPRGQYCISRQLLCDGRVNCVAGDSGGDTGDNCQMSTSINNYYNWQMLDNNLHTGDNC